MSRCGSGTREASVNSKPLTASPRYAGRVTPSRVSRSEERGLAYWPARRPSLTTGTDAAYVRTTAICRSTRSLLRTLSAVAPSSVSAQSPPWSRKASPRATAPSLSLRSSHSPAKTSGGTFRSRATASSSAARSGQAGCWAAPRACSSGSAGIVTGQGYAGVPRRMSVPATEAILRTNGTSRRYLFCMGLLERLLPSTTAPSVTWRVPAPGACRCENHLEDLLDVSVPLADGTESVSVPELLRSGALSTVPAADQMFVTAPKSNERRGPFHWRVVSHGQLGRFSDDAAPVSLEDALFVQPGVDSVLWLEDDMLLAVGAPRLCQRGVQAAVVMALTNSRIRLLA